MCEVNMTSNLLNLGENISTKELMKDMPEIQNK